MFPLRRKPSRPEDEQTTTSPISRVMFASLQNHETPVVTRWSYRPDDPFAVCLSIHRSGGRWVNWLFARELLSAGLHRPAGIGDVRVSMSRLNATEDLEVRIGSHDDRAFLYFDTAPVKNFLDVTLEIVPTGAESAACDVDGLIGKLSNSQAH